MHKTLITEEDARSRFTESWRWKGNSFLNYLIIIINPLYEDLCGFDGHHIIYLGTNKLCERRNP